MIHIYHYNFYLIFIITKQHLFGYHLEFDSRQSIYEKHL